MNGKTVISTFAGGGGSSLGYQWAGFDELLAIDNDKNAVKTLKANFDFPIWEKDIKEITAKDILTFCNIKKGELDILDGSPPCQGISTAGKRNIDDARNTLFKDFVRLIDGLQPKVFIMENVSGLAKGKYKGMFNEILRTLRALNYKVKAKQLNAKYYEVPQSRERIFFIGIRDDLNKEPIFPKPSKKIITVKRAFKNIPKFDKRDKQAYINPNYTIYRYMQLLKEGESGSKYNKNQSYYQLKRLSYNKEANTITKTVRSSASSQLHPRENRRINITEIKRLCSFPDNYKITGDFQEAWARLGNAVMPKQMYHIAKTIKECLDQKQK